MQIGISYYMSCINCQQNYLSSANIILSTDMYKFRYRAYSIIQNNVNK